VYILRIDEVESIVIKKQVSAFFIFDAALSRSSHRAIALCSSLLTLSLTLSDSLPSCRSGRCGQSGSADASPVPLTPALASRRGIGKYPPLSTSSGPGSSSPRGEAVSRIKALRAFAWTEDDLKISEPRATATSGPGNGPRGAGRCSQ